MKPEARGQNLGRVSKNHGGAGWKGHSMGKMPKAADARLLCQYLISKVQ
jgi:hypothetical protein